MAPGALTLLGEPHHDGSARYVSTPAPTLGETVTLLVDAPRAAGVRRLWVRTTPDAEPHFVEGRIDASTEAADRWRAEVLVANPVTGYRFLLDRGPAGLWWLTAAGLVDHEVPDRTDFRLVTFAPPPAWLADAVCYEVFPDRFARSAPHRGQPAWARLADWDTPVERRTGRQLYGGDLPGIEARLDHVEALGANLLYLTPFFPAESSHRYNASSFDRVDPLLGGDVALVSLVRAAHARGMRVIGDLTANHSGSAHEWFLKAQADPTSTEAGFYVFHGHPDDYEAWLGVRALPKFDLTSEELRRRLLDGADSVAGRWLAPPFDLDGWRVDVANMAGRLRGTDVNREAAHALRSTMGARRDDAYLVAEHAHDASAELLGDGWHGTMNYAGFATPVWSWCGEPDGDVTPFASPVPLPRRDGAQLAATIREFQALVPWRAVTANLNLLDSHDTARFRSIAGSRERALAGFGMLLTWPGVPMLFAGDELGLEGTSGDLARQPMPWDEPRRWDHDLHASLRELVAARHAHDALRHGGLRWAHVGPDVVVYLRESPAGRVLVQVARGDHEPVRLHGLGVRPQEAEPVGSRTEPLGSAGDGAVLPSVGAGVQLWSLQP